jgi:O-acetyl-ADP-ribose deacetylase (regulator of RNase III)
VHDFDLLPDGRGLLVMDWVAGQDLGKRLRSRHEPLPETEVLPWMRQVCEAMRVAAAQGIVHRDLKPSNILIDPEHRARVVDFGLARAPQVEQLSLAGSIMGTPFYMAPEQAEDPRTVDTRADIYSFGATFYHALTGQTPFDGPSVFQILFKHKTEPLISPKAVNPRLSDRLTECLERCMAKNPTERFATFDDVLTSLQSTGASPWDQGEDAKLEPYLERFRARRQVYLRSQRAEWPEPDLYEFPQGRQLTISIGNIVNQQVQALVSSCTDWVHTDIGVSAALATAAGPAMVAEARKYVPVRPGRAVVTSAGKLPARFIFHGVTIGYTRNEAVFPSRDLITEIMESCFYHADTLDVESMAFPLLGTGGAGFDPGICLDTMFRYLIRKLYQGLTTVRQVRLVIFLPVK